MPTIDAETESRCETCGTSLADCLYERQVTRQRCCGPCLTRDTHAPAADFPEED